LTGAILGCIACGKQRLLAAVLFNKISCTNHIIILTKGRLMLFKNDISMNALIDSIRTCIPYLPAHRAGTNSKRNGVGVSGLSTY